MNKEELILWLKRFGLIWDRCQDGKGDHHLPWLCDIYDRFLLKHGLPKWSADELEYELRTGEMF